MSKRTLSLVGCVLLVGIVLVCCRSDDPANALPSGEPLLQYNRAIAEVEGQQDLEN